MRFISIFMITLFISFSGHAGTTEIETDHFKYQLIPAFNTLKITNRQTNAESSIQLDSLPCAMVLHESIIYVVHFRGSYIYLISVPDHQVVKKVLLAEVAPDDICIYQDRGYVECASGVILVLDLKKHEFIGQFKVGKNPQEMLFQGKHAYIRCVGGSCTTLYVVDLLEYKVLRLMNLYAAGPITLSDTCVLQGKETVLPLYPYDTVYKTVHSKQSWEDYIRLDLETWKSVATPLKNLRIEQPDDHFIDFIRLFNDAACLAKTEILSYLHPAEQLNFLINSQLLTKNFGKHYMETIDWQYIISPKIYQTICSYAWRHEPERAIALLCNLRLAKGSNRDQFVQALVRDVGKTEARGLLNSGQVWRISRLDMLNFCNLVFMQPQANQVLENHHGKDSDMSTFVSMCVDEDTTQDELNEAFGKALASNDPHARSLMYLAFTYGLWGAPKSPELAGIYAMYNDAMTVKSYELSLR